MRPQMDTRKTRKEKGEGWRRRRRRRRRSAAGKRGWERGAGGNDEVLDGSTRKEEQGQRRG